jgi:hypothetical protein
MAISCKLVQQIFLQLFARKDPTMDGEFVARCDTLLELLEIVSPLSNENKVRHCVYIQRTSRIKCSILHIKCNNAYSYIQGNYFLGQSFDEPCFLFKMSTHDLGSGVELVTRMTKGDLKTSWVMFDHIKRMHD